MADGLNDRANVPYVTAADATGFEPRRTVPTPGFSATPGLRELPDSKVPGLAGGGMVSHVVGPQQNPVDPVAAGLDLWHDPMTRNENRVVTLTGEQAAGPRPTTYAGRGFVQQAAPATHELVPVPPEPAVNPPPGHDGELEKTREHLEADEAARAQEQPPRPEPPHDAATAP